MKKITAVYILTNYTHSTLYVGMTSDLRARVWQHRTKFYPDAFTARYNINYLVYYEVCENILIAIEREKQIKHWRREKKVYLIELMNPDWIDLESYL